MYKNLLFHVYMKLNMFRATHRPSSGAQNCTSSLWFCVRERLLDAEVAGQRPATSTFWATHRPSSGVQNCTSSLWFCIRERLLDVEVAGRWRRPATTRPTTFHVCKTRGCQFSFRFLMMGGMSPETCWASYKYGIINFDTVASCWIFLCELVSDIWTSGPW